MTLKKTTMGRVGTLVTALMLTSVGMAGVAAAVPGYDAPDSEREVTLTIHKHAGTNLALSPYPQDKPKDLGVGLAGVEFTIQPVEVGGTCVDKLDLAQPATWEAIKKTEVGSAKVCGEKTTAVTQQGGAIVVSSLKQGLYKVTETASGDNLVAKKSVPFLVALPMPNSKTGKWDYKVDVYPKNTLADDPGAPTKTADDPDTFVPGAKITWTVNATIPVLQLDYKQIVITDTIPEHLTFDSVTSVEIAGVPLEAKDYDVVDGQITLNGDGLAKVNAAMKEAEGTTMDLEVKLVTKVKDGIAGVVKNTVELTLNGKPTEPGKGTTVWGKVTVNKTDKNEPSKKLSDAVFAIYAGECKDVKENIEPVAKDLKTVDGTLSQTLYVGKTDQDSKAYCLKETAAPAGYLLDPKGKDFTLSSTGDFTMKIEFPNVKVEGPNLPLTGAQGTLLLVSVGVLLLAVGGGTVYAARRRGN